jgi:hypothetical protein
MHTVHTMHMLLFTLPEATMYSTCKAYACIQEEYYQQEYCPELYDGLFVHPVQR